MARKQEPPKPINTYGLRLNLPQEKQTQLAYDMAAFRWRWPIERGGLPRHEHFRNFMSALYPWLEWHPWLLRSIEAFCNNTWISETGCAASAKTTAFVIYAVGSWLCAPDCTSVIMTSTTKKMIRKRGWPWVQKLYTQLPGPRVGNMLDSFTTWQCKKGDDLNAIFGIAVREGSTAKAVAHIQGVHNRRIIVGVDEATDTPEAIIEATANLSSGCDDFQCIIMGNAASRFDPHGKACEPKDGWNSITVEDEEWETIPQMDNKPGICLHFDAEKSPNVIAGQTLYRYLPTQQGITAKREKLGQDSPLYWKFERGFWAPEGLQQTVLTESMIMKFNGGAKYIWAGSPKTKFAFLDPAFGGGDRPVLQFAVMGQTDSGITGLEMTERILLTLNAKDREPIHFQLARQVQVHCEQRGVSPNCFGIDATGEGGGTADILKQNWSHSIITVEFGGKPSDLPVSNEDRRMCKEMYDRKVTEIWFTVKSLLLAGQLRGIDASAGLEFCNRLWRLKGPKIEIEPKSKPKTTGDAEEGGSWGMKQRFGRSPDLADAQSGICQVARAHGLIVRAQGKTANRNDDWLAAAKRIGQVYEQSEEEHEPSEHPLALSYE